MYESLDFELLNNEFISSSLLGNDKRLIRTPSGHPRFKTPEYRLDIRI